MPHLFGGGRGEGEGRGRKGGGLNCQPPGEGWGDGAKLTTKTANPVMSVKRHFGGWVTAKTEQASLDLHNMAFL